jgi:hypothetical protein
MRKLVSLTILVLMSISLWSCGASPTPSPPPAVRASGSPFEVYNLEGTEGFPDVRVITGSMMSDPVVILKCGQDTKLWRQQ